MVCEDCGHVTQSRTAALAAHGQRLHSCEKTRRVQARAQRVEARKASSGRKVDCAHPRARHEHGTHAAFALDGCRCRPCRDATAAYSRRRNKGLAYGTWEPLVDAAPVREHLAALSAAGIGWKRAASLAGVAPSTVSKLLYGLGERPPSTRRVRPETARRLLAVRPSLDVMTGGARVDATGTHRRLRALACLGWSDRQLGLRLGVDSGNYGALMRQREVSVTRARDVVRLYDELWRSGPAETDHRTRQSASRARNRARAAGWAPPMAWDDDTIDDPVARPAPVAVQPGGRPSSGRGRALDLGALVEDVEVLVGSGVVIDAALLRLGVKRGALYTALHRAGRRDLWLRLTDPDAPLTGPHAVGRARLDLPAETPSERTAS